jgi:hypothetical protein
MAIIKKKSKGKMIKQRCGETEILESLTHGCESVKGGFSV